jgi:hypothetical protein
LVRGTVKSRDVTWKQMTFSDHANKDWISPWGDATVRLHRELSTIEDVKTYASALAIVEKASVVTTLQALSIAREDRRTILNPRGPDYVRGVLPGADQ